MPSLFDTLNTRADLDSLISGCVRESEILEYKLASSAFNETQKAELAKDVSAMANSGGGLIIYGIATDNTDRTKPVRVEQIAVANIETFDRVLNSQVKAPIRGIRKKLIPSDNPVAMLVDIPDSEDIPHQNLYDKKYYRRSGTESRPMEHDLVALYFGRRLGPVLSVRGQSLKVPGQFSGEPPFSGEASIRIMVGNSGRRVGRFVEIIMVMPGVEHLHLTNGGGLADISTFYLGRQARQFTDNLGVFHPTMNKSVAEIGFTLSKEFVEHHATEPLLRWTIYADEMTPRAGTITMQDLGWEVQIVPVATMQLLPESAAEEQPVPHDPPGSTHTPD